MSKVYRCTDCGNVTRFDKSGDGKCDECGALMDKTTDGALCDDDKCVLAEKDGEESIDDIKAVDLDTKNQDPLNK